MISYTNMMESSRGAVPENVGVYLAFKQAHNVLSWLVVSIGNTTPIAQEHEGMSCPVGGSLDWFLIDGDKGLKWFKYKLIGLGMNQVKEQVIVQ